MECMDCATSGSMVWCLQCFNARCVDRCSARTIQFCDNCFDTICYTCAIATNQEAEFCDGCLFSTCAKCQKKLMRHLADSDALLKTAQSNSNKARRLSDDEADHEEDVDSGAEFSDSLDMFLSCFNCMRLIENKAAITFLLIAKFREFPNGKPLPPEIACMIVKQIRL